TKYCPKGSMRQVLENSNSPIEWALKQKWALQIAMGVKALHQRSSYSGDLKLDNIILCSDANDIYLIDVYPTSGYTHSYTPPELDEIEPELTPARDVFALGIILWALSKEISEFEKEEIPAGCWVEDDEVVPNWFRQLVVSCLAEDPSSRPTVEVVVNTLSQSLTD
ncbi:kinase-like protein, partial [Dendrothele bispora CBS 962.96]